MKQINAFVYYQLSAYIREAVSSITPGIAGTRSTANAFIKAVQALQQFQKNEDPTFLRSSLSAAKDLRVVLQELGESTFKANESKIFITEDAAQAEGALTNFERMLAEDLNNLPLFCVEEKGKGNFSLPKLIISASAAYPEKTLKRLSKQAKNEIDESGRCLAFTRPTASAFHILRALELATKAYIKKKRLPMPPVKRCNWGEYIQVLRTGSAPKEITDLLQIIKDNYRNPIMHPEASLDLSEAVGLFGICQSAIEVLCR